VAIGLPKQSIFSMNITPKCGHYRQTLIKHSSSTDYLPQIHSIDKVENSVLDMINKGPSEARFSSSGDLELVSAKAAVLKAALLGFTDKTNCYQNQTASSGFSL
jgi:hypothetical protein